MKPIYIHIISYFKGHTGYNVHAREFAKALEQLTSQKNVTILRTSIDDQEEFKNNYHTLLEQQNAADIINICIAYGSQCQQLLQLFPGIKIGYTVWESTKLPDDWIAPLQSCDYVWTASNWGRQVFIDNGLAPQQVFVIPEGIDPEIFHPQQPPHAELSNINGFKFFSTGKCESRKGTQELIQAFDLEFHLDPNVFLVLAAENPFIPNFKMQTFVESLWLRNYHKFIYISRGGSHEQLAQMMAACDCGVFPTKAEGWGLPILESMALGQPTIVTNYSGVTEYANSDNAILLDYHTIPIDGLFFQRQDKDYGTWALVNTQTLRQKMREVYQNHQYYRAKSLAAAVDIKENWSWLASANKAWEFISKILAGEKVTNLKNDYRQSLEKQVKAATEFRDSLGLYTQAIIANTRQGSFAVDPEDSIIGKALRHHGGCWEHELKMLQSFFNDRSKVLVLGSHIGILTIPIAKECQEVVAFEANPKTYQLLKLNLMLNNIDNCRAFNLAASNKFEKLEFVLSRVNSGGSKRSPLVDRIEYFYDSPQTVMVDAVPVDSYIADRDFDLIIMDIEGSEYFALQGMQQILAQAKVLQIEFIPGHLQNVAGVGVEDFIAQIKPHFRSLIVPSQDLIVEQEKFTVVLEDMFDRGLSDAGIIFLKADRSQIHRSREQ